MESIRASTHPFLKFLSRIGNYVIGFTGLCYVVGFAITNLYLGSMGIVTFDILRARYIISGLLFIFFLGAIAYLLLGLIQTYRKNIEKPRIVIIGKALWFSILNIGLLLIVIPAIGLFAGSGGKQPYYVPQVTQPVIPWSDWFAQAPLSSLRTTGLLVGVALLSVIIVVPIMIIINPKDKDGKRTPRKKIIADAITKSKEIKWKNIAPLFGVTVLIYLLNLSVSLFAFYLEGRFSTTTKTLISFPEGWTQLFTTIVVIYAFISIYLTLIILYPSSNNIDLTEQPKSFSWIYLIAIGIMIIVPVYVSRVYPYIPQQIGGGQLISIDIVLSDNSIEPLIEDINTKTYLLDRTSTTSFFLLQNTTNSDYKIVEIQNDLIKDISYAHFP